MGGKIEIGRRIGEIWWQISNLMKVKRVSPRGKLMKLNHPCIQEKQGINSVSRINPSLLQKTFCERWSERDLATSKCSEKNESYGGGVIRCPSNKNGNKFRINWIITPGSFLDPNWLTNNLPNSPSTKKFLQEAIKEFNSRHATRSTKPQKAMSPSKNIKKIQSTTSTTNKTKASKKPPPKKQSAE